MILNHLLLYCHGQRGRGSGDPSLFFINAWEDSKQSFLSKDAYSKIGHRGDFKTQSAVDRRFRAVPGGCHCLEQ